jgi:glycosyltransferase involved in cell wall biosynthesis
MFHKGNKLTILNVVFVTNVPPPYRIPIFQKIGQMPGIRFQVIFCCANEPNRQWDLPPMDFDHIFLRERITTFNGRYIHNNLDVLKKLKEFSPDVVVTDGFNPTHLYAFAYALVKNIIHVPMTDGTDISEQILSHVHRAVRRFVYARSHAFISASMGGERLYRSYCVSAEYCFKSCLCINNAAFTPKQKQETKEFDFIFCGRIESVKNPLFALDVVRHVANSLHRKIKILFVGAGQQEESVKQTASMHPDLIEAKFHGFAAQNELPALYQSAHIFLFPTLWDPWGVVANEACAAGLPVIISPNAGAASELVIDGKNGYICDLDVKLWGERAAFLLTHEDVRQRFSSHSLLMASKYNFDNATSGFLDACYFALSNGAITPASMDIE